MLSINNKMQRKLIKSCQIIAIINIIFWLAIAIYFSFFKFASYENYLIIKLLLFLEPVFFAIVLVGLIKKIKIIYIFSILFVFANGLLSITDELGLYDIASLILNLSLLTNLLLIWKYFSKKKVLK